MLRKDIGIDDSWCTLLRDELEENLSNSSEMAAAKTALELRRSQSWASLNEDGDLSEEQVGSVETALDQMNQDLDALANELVSLMEQDELPGRRDMMGWTADVLDVMIEADDALYDALDADQRESVDDAALDPFSYVDPDLMDTFGQIAEGAE